MTRVLLDDEGPRCPAFDAICGPCLLPPGHEAQGLPHRGAPPPVALMGMFEAGQALVRFGGGALRVAGVCGFGAAACLGLSLPLLLLRARWLRRTRR